MSMSIEPSQDRRRWGGLSQEPDKAARQLAGLARNNPALAARLTERQASEPGESPERPGNLPGENQVPGNLPGNSENPPGSVQTPGELPAKTRDSPGKAPLPGRVVPGRYRSEVVPERGLESDPAAEAPALGRLGRFYAQLLGYSVDELRAKPVGDSAAQKAPALSRFESFYARLLGYRV